MAKKKEETINVEEETVEEEEGTAETRWTEEFKVAGDELLDAVKKLVRETNVRRIVIKNKERRIYFEFPLVFGLAGIALLPVYSALALIAALVTDCTIMVERVEEPAESAE